MIKSDAPNCGVTYDRLYDDRNNFIIQATAYKEFIHTKNLLLKIFWKLREHYNHLQFTQIRNIYKSY
jgi:hypothetical protein